MTFSRHDESVKACRAALGFDFVEYGVANLWEKITISNAGWAVQAFLICLAAEFIGKSDNNLRLLAHRTHRINP